VAVPARGRTHSQWLTTKVDLDEGLAVASSPSRTAAAPAEAVHDAIITQPGNRRERRGDAATPTRFGSTPTSPSSHATRIETTNSEVSHVVLDGSGGNTWEHCSRLSASSTALSTHT